MARPGSLASNSMTWFGADVLGRGEPAQCGGDQRDQVRAGDGRGGDPAAGEVGVDGVGEAAGEHGPVAAVDTHRILDDLLTDLGAVFELADAGFEIGGHGRILPGVAHRLPVPSNVRYQIV
jgi:hypothetical protein